MRPRRGNYAWDEAQRRIAMPHIVRLRKPDGTVVDLPDIYRGDAPSKTVQTAPVLVVTMLRWMDRKAQGTGN